ncbi:MAG: hypothetical protein H5U12_27980 [Hoeflea sp.]|nr:hypothetical protein [Hoeflea sp.]
MIGMMASDPRPHDQFSELMNADRHLFGVFRGDIGNVERVSETQSRRKFNCPLRRSFLHEGLARKLYFKRIRNL